MPATKKARELAIALCEALGVPHRSVHRVEVVVDVGAGDSYAKVHMRLTNLGDVEDVRKIDLTK